MTPKDGISFFSGHYKNHNVPWSHPSLANGGPLLSQALRQALLGFVMDVPDHVKLASQNG